MTDRVHSLIVVFDKDYREDDAQPLMDAIRMLRPVIEVRSVVGTPEHYAAREQAKAELRAQLFAVLRP